MSGTKLRYRRNVAAVIMDARGNVLVGKKKEGSRFVHFPQGGVDKKETFEQALWREIKEEVGFERASMHIVAHLAGLSYDYRKKNKKKEKWAGQEQTYYLIRYDGPFNFDAPRDSNEFGVLEWVPYKALHPEMFVSFKRPVVAEVLSTFFPKDMPDMETHAAGLNTLLRYRFSPASHVADFSPYDRAFFAGGKQEAISQMSDLRTRICRAQQQLSSARVLIILADSNQDAKRRTNCLRRIAELCDPILTRVPRPVAPAISPSSDTLLPVMVPSIPAEGETLMLSESIYSRVDFLSKDRAEGVAMFEQLLLADGVMVLKFFLNITPEQCAKSGGLAGAHQDGVEELLQQTAHPVPWHMVPAEKKWYRDYVISSIVAQSLENLVASAQNAPLSM